MYGLVLFQVKEHSDFSFLSLIFGPQGDTQKQLEKVSHLQISWLLFAAIVPYLPRVNSLLSISHISSLLSNTN